MKNPWTWRKIGIYLGILGIGIIGIVIADQQDFLSGRPVEDNVIGTGNPEPIASPFQLKKTAE